MAKETIYDSVCVADYLVRNSERGLDPLQTLKLSYIAHGFTLALRDKPLLEDDVEAWQYGPVIRPIYNALPGGSAKITGKLLDKPALFDEDDKRILNTVLKKYGHLSGLTLSSLTHSKGSPWDETWQAYGKNAVIPQELIQSHYQKILAKYAQAKRDGLPYAPKAL